MRTTFLILWIFILKLNEVYLDCEETELSRINYTTAESISSIFHSSTRITTNSSLFLLKIENQTLSKLCCNYFNILHPLHFLIMDKSRIEMLEEHCFSKRLQQVSQISLVDNYLTSIKSGTFKDIRIANIYLGFNLIQTIEDGSFVNLSHLELLDLSFNYLKTFNPKAFQRVPMLHFLLYDNNSITSLKKNSFKFLERACPIIVFRNNRISQLENGVFEGCDVDFISLSLEGNMLDAIPEGVFEGHVFGRLQFEGNPLRDFSREFCEKCEIVEFTYSCQNFDIDFNLKILEWAKDNEISVNTFSSVNKCNASLYFEADVYCDSAQSLIFPMIMYLYLVLCIGV